jgi:hypothetical protein
MNLHSVANRGLALVCVTLRDDPIYQERATARAAAGRADHLLKFSIEEELKPRGKVSMVARGRPCIVYPDHDADPSLEPDIHTEQDRKRFEVYLRSRERRRAEDAEVTNAVVTARSRFPVLHQLLQPGLARERFVRRWRRGKVNKTLEILILRIAAIMDRQAKRRRGMQIVIYGRFRGDLMSREHDNCGPSCPGWRLRHGQASSADGQPAGDARGRARDPKVTKNPTASASPAVPGKARPPRPTPAAEAAAGAERVVDVRGEEFVMDPDVGDGADA